MTKVKWFLCQGIRKIEKYFEVKCLDTVFNLDILQIYFETVL